MIKQSYPNYSDYRPELPVYDIQKWIGALKNIYLKVRLGSRKQDAIDEIINSWPQLEKYNFSNWMRYYESGEMDRYKIAAENSYYENADEHYFLPNPKNTIPSPIQSINVQQLQQDANNIARQRLSEEERKAANEKVRKSLIGRLNSIEKILGNDHGFTFAGNEYSDLLTSIQSLKAKILTHNRTALSARTYADLLIREANILKKNNCSMSSDLMIKLAQQIPGNIGNLDAGMPGAGGAIEGGGSGAGTTPIPNLSEPPAGIEDEESPIDKFLENISPNPYEDNDIQDIDDEIKDEVFMCEDEIEIDSFSDFEDELIVMGQEIPEEEIKSKIKPQIKSQKEIREIPVHSDFDALVNSAFDKLTIEDLLAKLQDINLIFQKKEINKQLALADLMFSKLQFTPYFPEFAEIQQKQLDAANYSLTRMNSIISTLQGGIGKSKINLSDDTQQDNPESLLLQRHLENEERKEKERKELRKEVNERKLREEKPEIEIENPEAELAKIPSVENKIPKIEKQPALPIKPIAPGA